VSEKHSMLILTHFYAILVFAFFILSDANDQRQKIHSTYRVPELANVLMTLCIHRYVNVLEKWESCCCRNCGGQDCRYE